MLVPSSVVVLMWIKILVTIHEVTGEQEVTATLFVINHCKSQKTTKNTENSKGNRIVLH